MRSGSLIIFDVAGAAVTIGVAALGVWCGLLHPQPTSQHLADLQSKKRSRSIAFPRQICMYLARTLTRHSLEEIGGYFGGRDHTTVMHACDKIDRVRKEDPALHAIVDRLTQHLRRHRAAATCLPTWVPRGGVVLGLGLQSGLNGDASTLTTNGRGYRGQTATPAHTQAAGYPQRT